MRVLGLDIATTTGWAVLDASGRVASGAWDCSVRRHEGSGMRLVRFRAFLREAIEHYQPDVIAYELVERHEGTGAAHVYGALQGALLEEGEVRGGLAIATVPVGHIKQYATGRGNARKAAMVKAAKERWGIDPTEDEADALWVAATWKDTSGLAHRAVEARCVA